LMRSINTTITTVLPVLSMLVIGGILLGGATLRDFALALFIGLILGTYSSIFVAAPVLAWLKEREPVDDETRRRQRRAAEAFGAADNDAASGESDTVASDADSDTSAPVTVGGVTPRPRKKRKKRK